MEKKISVIIPEQKDHTYLIRCLNSIYRQTFKTFEIILMGTGYPSDLAEKYPAVVMYAQAGGKNVEWRDIFQRISGDYIYFCSETSVPAPNVLADLLSRAQDDAACVSAQLMIPDGKNFSVCVRAEATVYGKLLKRERLLKLSDAGMPDGANWLEWAMPEYLKQLGCVKRDARICVYETDEQVFALHAPTRLPKEQQKKWLENISVYSQDVKTGLTDAYLAALQQEYGTGTAADAAVAIAEIMNQEKEVNYEITRKYVKEWYREAAKSREEKLYLQVREYLACFDAQEEYQRVLLYACGIGREQYAYMKKCALEEYLFYRDRLTDEQGFLDRIRELEAVKRELVDCRSEIALLRERVETAASGKTCQEAEIAAAGNVTGTALTGPALAEYVIQSYGQGGLGLKTIMKSFGAWVKYKF